MPALHGFIVLWALATPTIAFSKSPSPKPTARSIARFGERAAPWVMVLLLQLSAMGKTPNAENQLSGYRKRFPNFRGKRFSITSNFGGLKGGMPPFSTTCYASAAFYLK